MIRKTITFICIFLSPLTTFSADDSWIDYSPNDGYFSIQFPARPEVSSVIRDEYTAYAVSSQKNDVLYKVVYSIHETNLAEGDKELFLDNAKSMFVNTQQGKVKSEKRITAHNNKGYEIKFITPNDQYIDYMIFFDSNVLYTLNVVANKNFAPKKDVKRFFDSFKVVPYRPLQNPEEQGRDSTQSAPQKTGE